MIDLRVEVNGQSVSLDPGSTVADLILQLELEESGVAVAVNHMVVPRSQRHEMLLQSCDCVEVIQAVGGG